VTDIREDLQAKLGPGFTLERELGGGGMSRVFVVADVALGRRLVVKVLPPELAAEVSLARFEREIGLAARLQHPHIVSLLSAGETRGVPYYVMPFVEGESLRQRLTRGELPIAEAVRLMREIASALAYAHDQGVVHRDVKPENVLLSGGIALVADFGVAKAVADSATTGSGLTGTGVSVGTPAYMSPEQVSADPNVDHRADLYALGMIAYEMLAGHSPFAGRTAQALLAAHVIDAPEPIQKRRPAVPDAVAALVMRCLEKRPADRPQHASEIVHALDTLITPTSVRGREALAPMKRRSRTVAGAVAAILVVAAVGVAWVARVRGNRPALAPATPRLLIAPFENLTGDKRFDHIGLIATDRLSLAVSQRGSIEVVPSNTVLMALRDTTGGVAIRLNRLSDATHAGLIVSGTVVLRGDSLMLQAQVTDVRTGKAIMTLDPATGPAADPTAAIDKLGDRLLGALGTREIAILPSGFRPPKFAAYQEFAAGFERFARQGDNMGSRPFFERAIAIDSTYTQAYQLLARQYLNAGEYARADSLIHRIERLPQGLTAVERLNLEYSKAELRGDIPGLLHAQQQLAARDSSPLSLALIGEAAMWLLRPALAVAAMERSHAAYLLMGGRAGLGHTSQLAESYHEAGLYDRELRMLVDDGGGLPSDQIKGRLLRAYAGLRRAATALAVADTILRAEGPDAGAAAVGRVMTGADEFRAHGDTITAVRLIALARAWIAAHPSPPSSSGRRMAEGIVLLASGMADSALERFTLLARDTTRLDAAAYTALSRIARGDSAGARAVADSLGKLQRPWLFGSNTFWQAAIVGALGKRDVAVDLLRQANHEGQPMYSWHYVGALRSLHGYPAFETLVRPER
jgi:serine/threonine-protein kinase